MLGILAMLAGGLVGGAGPVAAGDKSMPNWVQLGVGGPSPRQSASMAYDGNTHKLVLFGGYPGRPRPREVLLGDTWTWDGTTWTKQQPATSPDARYGAEMAYDAATRQLVLVGGGGDMGRSFGDTWTWDGATWTEQHPATRVGVSGGSMAYDPATRQLVLVGGGAAFQDTWTWDGITWTLRHPATSPPSGDPAMAYDIGSHQLVVLVGGTTWTWNGKTWTQRHPTASPPASSGTSMAYDPAARQLVLFGGTDFTHGAFGSRDDTWTWNGKTWTQQHPLTSPSARNSAAMAYDPASDQLILFGGLIGFMAVNDTWVYKH